MARQAELRRNLSRAKEQFNDELSDLFARVHKDQKVFYVGSVDGNSAFSGRRVSGQKATIAQAYDACTASRGDKILVSPFHTETVTSVLTMSKIGVQIHGLKLANQRPVITINGAVDMFSFTAAAQKISGLELTIATTDAATAFVNFAAVKCVVEDCKLIPSATSVNVVDCFTLASGGDDGVIRNCEGYNTTVAINSWISIEAAVARFTIENNLFRGDVATAGIIDGATATQLGIFRNKIVTIGTNIPACILDSNPTGQAIGNHMYGTDATIANNAQWGSALILGDNFTRGGTGSTVSASNIIPALDT